VVAGGFHVEEAWHWQFGLAITTRERNGSKRKLNQSTPTDQARIK